MIRSFHKGIKYECSECKKFFTSKENLELHQKTTHPAVDDTIQNIENTVQDSSHDSKRALSEEDNDIPNVLNHALSEDEHTSKFSNHSDNSEKTFSCDQCEKLFDTKENYDTHLKNVHECDKSFICTICDKNFTQQTALKNHMSIHEVMKQYYKFAIKCWKFRNH